MNLTQNLPHGGGLGDRKISGSVALCLGIPETTTQLHELLPLREHSGVELTLFSSQLRMQSAHLPGLVFDSLSLLAKRFMLSKNSQQKRAGAGRNQEIGLRGLRFPVPRGVEHLR